MSSEKNSKKNKKNRFTFEEEERRRRLNLKLESTDGDSEPEPEPELQSGDDTGPEVTSDAAEIRKGFKIPIRGDILFIIIALIFLSIALGVFYFTTRYPSRFDFFKSGKGDYQVSKTLIPDREFKDIFYQKGITLYESGFLPAAYDQFDRVVSSSVDKQLKAAALIYMGI
ncbi:MAG: hypothetical protein KAS39_04530, partial [Actinomycetia bacterium]|nr:hypothetical protein [Actinomycetes bacterium]